MLVPSFVMIIAEFLLRPWSRRWPEELSGKTVELAITETPDSALLNVIVQGVVEEVITGVAVEDARTDTVPDECAVVRLEKPFPAPKGGEWASDIGRFIVMPRFAGYRFSTLRFTYIAVNVYGIRYEDDWPPRQVSRQDLITICLMRLKR